MKFPFTIERVPYEDRFMCKPASLALWMAALIFLIGMFVGSWLAR